MSDGFDITITLECGHSFRLNYIGVPDSELPKVGTFWACTQGCTGEAVPLIVSGVDVRHYQPRAVSVIRDPPPGDHDIELVVTFRMKRYGISQQNQGYVDFMCRQIELAFGKDAIISMEVAEQ